MSLSSSVSGQALDIDIREQQKRSMNQCSEIKQRLKLYRKLSLDTKITDQLLLVLLYTNIAHFVAPKDYKTACEIGIVSYSKTNKVDVFCNDHQTADLSTGEFVGCGNRWQICKLDGFM